MRNFNCQYSTKKNNNSFKPNEDYKLVDSKNEIYILCDGITRTERNGIYPNPSPSSEVSKIFARTVHQKLIELEESGSFSDNLIRAIKKGNEEVNEFNSRRFPKVDYLVNDLAGTVGIVSYIKNGFFYYAYIGDCIGLFVKNKHFQVFTKIQTLKVEEYRKKVGFSDNETIKIRKEFRNNLNHPFSYGAITGEESIFDFITLGKIDTNKFDKIILMSDGLLNLLRLNPEFILFNDAKTIIKKATELESKYNFRSDDKSIIIIENERNTAMNKA